MNKQLNIGKAIRYCRENRRLSQKDLATQADVSVSHLCLIENSKREASLTALESIAKALDIPLSVLVLLASSSNIEPDLDLNKIKQLVFKLIEAPK